MKILLSDAIDEYLASRRAQGLAKNTLRNNTIDLKHLLTSVGNIYTENIDGRHIDATFAALASRRGPAALNNTHATYTAFFRWCRQRRYMPRDGDPMEGRRLRRVQKRTRHRVPLAKFPALLDAAKEPRDRMIIALGLYTFLRQSEMASIKLADVDLDSGELSVTIHKTGEADVMPISAELDREIRRWYLAYQEAAGPLQPDWNLIPGRYVTHRHRNALGQIYKVDFRLYPTRTCRRMHEVIRPALEAVGIPTTDEEGRHTGEGIHTLRRSGARALFDELQTRGYDGAGRATQTWLHHKSFAVTERYLGIDLDKKRRDEVKGEPMFPSLEAATPLQSVKEETA